MDGLLVIDKPTGPTSHDIVATARRVLRERRIGHTGTLDPLASGVLPLVVGRATRLAQFLTASEKEYAALVRLGVATDSGDRLGTPQGPEHTGAWPTAADVERALTAFRGTFSQQPPAYSAKKIEGRRSYRLARARSREIEPASGHAGPGQTLAAGSTARPAAVMVTTTAVELTALDGPLVSLRIVCSAGFYVRSLAAELGAALGTGGHLSELRRTRSGSLGLERAVTLDALVNADPGTLPLVPLDEMLPEMPEVRLTPEGTRRAMHGQDIGPLHVSGGWPAQAGLSGGSGPGNARVRLREPSGELVAIADRTAATGLLHPAVVLK